ncbi:MAG: ABC transporter permease [Lachnospiraceae bacterium]
MKKKKNYSLIIGCILTGIIGIFVLLGFFYTPYDPEAMDNASKLAGVSLQHVMGADHFGRDIFSRILVGCKTTFLIATITVFIGTIIGSMIGAIAGFYGGILDEILMRCIDVLFAFPSILLALTIVGILGPGEKNVIIALGIGFIPSFARIVRSEYKKYSSQDFVKSLTISGVSKFRIIFVHILPNCYPILLSTIMIGFNNAVIAEASMSYLGIGVQPPTASLGRMLSEAQTYLFSSPTFAVFPGLMIIVMVLGFSQLADGFLKLDWSK